MQREIIRPQFDKPIVVKLDFGPEGVERQSKFGGTEYQYTVNDDAQIIYLTPQGRSALMKTGAEAGDYVQLCKSKRGGEAYFDVRVVSDAQEEPQTSSYTAHNGQQAACALPQQGPRIVSPSPAARTNGYPNGTAKPAPQTVWPMEEIAKGAFESAARIVKHGEEYAKSIGLPVEANFDDVRSLAISFLIDRQRRQA